ncbi:hypothetical protein MHUMG1_07969 [Metarhizium humberi]|uniref:CCHC-type domain-containing protein n=1 Tax=Metarhizium humberi TaxID=2596975 RepID=A0A9P8M8Q2_9HYPO|nr:hypothetical protein MHUMG1_07969 [Metarhizium humberi]
MSNAGDNEGIRGETTTGNIQDTVREALPSAAWPDDPTSRMMARGLFPAPLRPPRNMFGISTRQLALPTIQGQVPGPQEPQGCAQAAQPQGPAAQPPQRQDAQRPRQNRARGRGSRGANRGGVQKSGQQGTSSSADNIKAKMDRDPEFLKEVEELAKRREQETSRAALERSKKATICGNCLEPGHTVRDCVHPAEDGFVHGCPLCNGADHESAQGCKMDWPHRLERRLYWAIEQRARRPTLAAFSNWMEVFTEARNAGNVALPQSFPWTPIHSRRLMNSHSCPWLTFDYAKNDSSELPRDPLTLDQNTVLENEWMLRALPNAVVGRTGGNPCYPRQLELTG